MSGRDWVRQRVRNEIAALELEAEAERGPAPPLEAAAYTSPERRLQVVVVHQIAVILVRDAIAGVAILATGHDEHPVISWSPWWWRGPIRPPLESAPRPPVPPPHPQLRAHPPPQPAPQHVIVGDPPREIKIWRHPGFTNHTCVHCGKIGHTQRWCPDRRRPDGSMAPIEHPPFPWIA